MFYSCRKGVRSSFKSHPIEYTIIKHALAAVMKKNSYPSIAVNYGLFMPLYTYILYRGAESP